MKAIGDTFTFDPQTGTEGDWQDHLNWDGPASETPGADDTAIISSGTNCNVENASRSIETLDVQGTLLIVGKNLTIYPDGSTAQTVDGTTTALPPRAGCSTPSVPRSAMSRSTASPAA